VGVDVHRDGDGTVPEQFHDGPAVDALGEEQRRAGVLQIVQPDAPDAGGVAQRVEVPIEVPRLDRRADRRGEDEAGFGPPLPCGVFLRLLAALALPGTLGAETACLAAGCGCPAGRR
jgi:hypothetical protein